ncbi:MAG: hypothetical protein KBD01_05140 [Acidobacteria bacterium]|nr:hypothetical protein [Acidobacteriota bacterium]
MGRPFRRVFARAEPLGSYAAKFTRAIEQHGELLLARLDATGLLTRVPIDRTAPSLAEAFDHVASSARDDAETLRLLGTYYAVQFVHLNGRLLERLAFDLAERRDRDAAFREFLDRSDQEFTTLASTYIRRVLRVLVPSGLPDRFVLCAVGSRGHQDDIDVAVVDEGGAGREAINRIFARLSVQMLRYASALDHYLAARVGAQGVATSPGELARALHEGPLDFVVVSELLRAEPLAGTPLLHRRLRQEVISRFYFRPGQDNSRHEYYLRGVLGEIRSLLLRPLPATSINPKEDALRLILGLVLSFKTTDGLASARSEVLLRRIGQLRPALRPTVARLASSHVFLETFHHLAHLLIAQEDEVELGSPEHVHNLERVAAAMGYGARGPVRPVEHLLVHYHEAVEAAREAALPLMQEIARHLAETSHLSRWTRGPLPERLPADAAVQVADLTLAFRGARFWDDLLEALAAPDGALLAGLVESFAGLPADERAALAQRLAGWGRDAPYSLLSILVLIARRAPRAANGVEPGVEITRAFLDQLGPQPEDVRALSRVFRFYPALVNRFLLALDREGLARLRGALAVPIGNPEVAAARDKFDDFIRIHQETSRYVKRVLARVTDRHPASVLALADDATMRVLARGRLAAGERHPDVNEQKRLLGDFYDLEFLRVSLEALRGAPTTLVQTEYADLVDNYLVTLFDTCLRQVERESGTRLVHRERLALYVTGGQARRRPFVEDFDLLVLTDSEDAEDRRLAERAVVVMNHQMAHRGMITQYRFASIFGRFVTTIGELEELLGTDPRLDLFVERHQLLCSRLLLGGHHVEAALDERVLGPFVFGRGVPFGTRLWQELRERRAEPAAGEGFLQMKEMPGGFREIDLYVGACCARAGVRIPQNADVFGALAEREPDHADEHLALRRTDAFLASVRAAYRVSVAATSAVEREYLDAPARLLGYPDGASLGRKIERRAAEAAEIIGALIAQARRLPA